jgi:copper chaperone NosL
MQQFLQPRLEKFYAFLDTPMRLWSRVILAALVLPMALSFTQPLWRISMFAPQYPHGLMMDIFSYKLDGGHQGHDIDEINELNHYIGMMKIDRAQMSDLDWIPFAFGFLILVTLRAAAIGNVRSLIDLSVLICYVSLFALARFVYKLYAFGHYLDPHAPVHIQPFMPVILGTKQVANFTTHSYPMLGSALIGAFAAGTVLITVWHLYRGYQETWGTRR